MSWSIEIRPSTQEEIDLVGANASTVDGSAAILIDGSLFGITDEYGSLTVFVTPNAKVPLEVIERIEQAVEVLTSLL